MTTSPSIAMYKPGSNKISQGDLGYICARNRQRAFNLVIREFKKSGITQAELARRLGKAAEVISRLLSRPRNWELDTFSELMFGISGAIPSYGAEYPLEIHKALQFEIIERAYDGPKTNPSFAPSDNRPQPTSSAQKMVAEAA
jgi:transcriptional regulator with XRE-family HTH domain